MPVKVPVPICTVPEDDQRSLIVHSPTNAHSVRRCPEMGPSGSHVFEPSSGSVTITTSISSVPVTRVL